MQTRSKLRDTRLKHHKPHPLAALLGGIALGAAAGALMPRSDREKALLAPLGDKLAAAASAAIAAGREAGADALRGTALDKDALRNHTQPLASLSGKTVSGGLLSVAAALSSVN